MSLITLHDSLEVLNACCILSTENSNIEHLFLYFASEIIVYLGFIKVISKVLCSIWKYQHRDVKSRSFHQTSENAMQRLLVASSKKLALNTDP